MNLLEKIGWYYRHYGLRALLRKGLDVAGGAKQAAARVGYLEGIGTSAAAPVSIADPAVPASSLLAMQFSASQPLPVYTTPEDGGRLNLVTDSISRGHLFGGVATAILLAAQLAKARRARLRIVTRGQYADEAGFAQVLECNGIEFPGNVEFTLVGVGDRKAQLDVGEGDRFLTTSWWTTASVLGSVSASRVDYLLQEDERMFYAYGDEWLRCSEVLQRADIRYAINTSLLFEHLTATGLPHLRERGRWFEPAFPAVHSRQAEIAVDGTGGASGKRKLFFYARPNNLRNLFYRGIEVLDRAVSEGVIDPAVWDVVFVGKDVPSLLLGGVLRPIVLPTMGWQEYGDFIRSVDLGFCLMCTPHPSYPPLDLASAGKPVVTNRFSLKQDLSGYSPAIIACDMGVDDLLKGLRRGIAMASLPSERIPGPNGLATSWQAALAPIVKFLD